jgi:glutamate decarboxylase
MDSESKGNGLPLVAFRFDTTHKQSFDEFALAHELRRRGWIIPAYTMAANATKLKLMRIVCRNDFSRIRCDSLISDIKAALERLRKIDRAVIQPRAG